MIARPQVAIPSLVRVKPGAIDRLGLYLRRHGHAGAMVVVPNYALCPRVGIEHIALQMTQAVAWAWRHAREHGGDPNRIVLVGHSAGGHLAAMLACCDWKTVGRDLPRRLVKGAMSISGVHDLEPVPHIRFLADDLRLDADRARRLSPVQFPPPPLGLPVHALVGATTADVASLEMHAAVPQRQQACQRAHQRGFAGAIAANHRRDRPRTECHVHATQHHDLAIAGTDASGFKQDGHGVALPDKP